MLSRATVGWLILAAALAVFACGVGLRVFVGRNSDNETMQRIVRRIRATAVARLLYGPVAEDAFDDDELDQMFLMPSLLVACGMCLIAIFLIGIELLH